MHDADRARRESLRQTIFRQIIETLDATLPPDRRAASIKWFSDRMDGKATVPVE